MPMGLGVNETLALRPKGEWRRGTWRVAGVHLVAALVLCTACTAGRLGGGDHSSQIARDVRVTNDNREDVVVYALVNGQRTRLGMATAKLSTTLTIPESVSLVTGNLRLLVDAIGSRLYWTSPVIMPSGGAYIDLVVGPRLSLSQVVIR